MRTFIEDWSRRTTISADFQAQGKRPLPLAVEQALFRVAQEALANVARHSRAEKVAVHLLWQADVVTLLVRDDGQGFVAADRSQAGMGLSNMTERMTAVNGRLTVTSSPGAGTTIEAEAAARLTDMELLNDDR